MPLTKHTDKKTPMRVYRIGAVGAFEELTDVIQSESPHFLLFVALDAAGIAEERIRKVSRRLIDQGCVGLCVWGNECERVHDTFDLERGPDENDTHVVMTTWHDEESLEEALWYFANCAYPTDGFEPTCNEWVAVSIGNDKWEGTMHKLLVEENGGSPP
jgi:hypothetical protein